MPCYEPPWPGENIPELKEKISFLTRLLCEFLTAMEKMENSSMADDRDSFENVMSDELSIWWEEHKKLDKKRSK
jgi:hypothetical protein